MEEEARLSHQRYLQMLMDEAAQVHKRECCVLYSLCNSAVYCVTQVRCPKCAALPGGCLLACLLRWYVA